jgi:RNA polymerase sigma factor (sigma-70 family)
VRLSVARQPGPQRVVDTLYRKHVGDVYRYALAVMGDSADAEDVTQTTFLNAFRALERGDEVREPKAWLRAIAHNVCRQRFRQLSRRPNEVPFDEDAGEVIEEHHGPTAEDVARALKHLPFNQRSALVMRELEGRSPHEIAEALGVTLAATETLLFRARRSLREQIEGSLTCEQAEAAISQQADGLLARSERGALRAHLRECSECARTAKSVRAQRGALKALAAVPLPPGLALASGFGGAGGGGAAVATSIFGKLAIGGIAATLVAGGTVEVASKHPWSPSKHHARPASTHSGAAAGHGRPQDSTPISGSTLARPKRSAGHHPTPAAHAKPHHPHNAAQDSIPAARPGPAKHIAAKVGHAITKARKQHAAKVKLEKAAKPRKQHVAKTPRQQTPKTKAAPKAKAVPKQRPSNGKAQTDSPTTTDPTPAPTKPERGSHAPAVATPGG